MKRIIFTIFMFIFSLSIFADNNIETLKDSISYYEGVEKARVLLEIGSYYYPNKNDSALLYIEWALAEYKLVNNEKGVIRCYGFMGSIYSNYGMYDTAVSLNYKVIEWGKKNNDIYASIGYLELANTYKSMDKFVKAKEFYVRAINGSYFPAKMAAFANMGILYLESENYDSAYYYFNGALQEYYKADTSLAINKYNIATIYLNLTTVDYGNREYEKGIKLLNKSLGIFNEIGNMELTANVNFRLGEGYEYLQNNELAMEYYLKAKKIADSYKIPIVKEKIYLKLFEYYQEKKDLENAIISLIEYEKIHDSLIVASYSSSIVETEIKYKVQSKINKIASLEREKQVVFSYSIVIVLGLLLISSIIILILNNKRLKHRNAKLLSDAKSNLSKAKAKSAQQELDRIVVQLHEKSAFIEELEEEVKKLSTSSKKLDLEDKIKLLRETRILTDDDWERYNRIFIEIHPMFSFKVENYDVLSIGDKRQLIFLKLGLKQKEISYLMGITPEGVKRARQRVAKKVGLNNAGELKEYIVKL